MNKGIKLTGLRANDKILSDSISFIASNLRGLVFPILKLTIPVLIAIMIAESFLNNSFSTQDGTMFKYFLEGSYYSAIGSILSYLLITLFILSGLTLHYRNEGITLSAIVTLTRNNSLSILLLTVLLFVASVFSVILLFIPLVFLYVLYSIATVELVVEDTSIFGSIKRAHQLLRGSYWRTFWLTMILGIIQFFSSFIFEIPSTIFGIAYPIHDTTLTMGMVEIVTLQVFELLSRFSFVFSIIFWTGIYMQYFNLREIKSGDVLLDQIEEKFGRP